MASCPKLVINLEKPDVNVQVVGNQPCQRLLEFLFIIDIISGNGDWDVTLLEDALCSRFSGEN
jgi:hypothetical protein